jgi:hypothetical protein
VGKPDSNHEIELVSDVYLQGGTQIEHSRCTRKAKSDFGFPYGGQFTIPCGLFTYTGQDGLVVPLHLILTVQLWVQFPS